MKWIIAIIQPHRLEAVKTSLTEVEVFRLTVSDVQGYGRQKGHTEYFRGQPMQVNLIRKGRNYGWPVVEGAGNTQRGRFTNPVVTWSPTSESSPSGAAISGDELYVSALAGRRLWRIKLDGASAGKPEALFTQEYGRIRAVAAAPDGSIWFGTSNRDGRGDPKDGDDRILQLGT